MLTAAKKENKKEGDKTVLGLCIQKSETFQFIHWMGRSLLPVQMGKKHSSRSSKIFVFAEEKKNSYVIYFYVLSKKHITT